MIPTRFILPAGALVLGLAIGLGAGWKLYRPKPAQVETAAPAVRQADKSLVLQRQPEAKPQPKHELPKGAKLERQIQVTVLPSIPTDAQKIPGSGNRELLTTNPISSSLVARQITVDLSLVKMPDGTQRVIASSPDGVVSSGLDIPASGPSPNAKPLKWAAGALWNPSDRTFGAYVRRALGPFEVGAQVYQERLPVQAGGGTTGKAMISVGVRW